MRFPTAEKILLLYELEQEFIKFSKGIIKEHKFISPKIARAREFGRAHGFLAASALIAERLEQEGKKQNDKR